MIDFKTFNMRIEKPKDKEVEVFGEKVKVRQFISSNDKRDLLLITLQQSLVDNIINPFYLYINFHVNLIKMYTDIVFSEEDLKDNFDLYDKLEISGILDIILNDIPDNDYSSLQDDLDELVIKYNDYYHSTTSVINSILEQLPRNVENAQNAIKDFDPGTLKQIIDLAKQTGLNKIN